MVSREEILFLSIVKRYTTDNKQRSTIKAPAQVNANPLAPGEALAE